MRIVFARARAGARLPPKSLPEAQALERDDDLARRETDDVRIRALDPRNEPRAAALHRVRASFVLALAARDVRAYLRSRERSERHAGRHGLFMKRARRSFRGADG